ncbi:hypothetical protein FPOA_08623 [Fusarium poae]|uniref:Uncharacterized protein n=1 Tax=Fusarium poae TaxID=36050 RepID=A0A1B8AP49_FUSPO|nr:hypothetical protein FPOA_08623 [Fusarium poae]
MFFAKIDLSGLGSSQDQTSSLNIWQINPGRTDQVVDAIVGREETTAPTSNAETDHSVPSQDGVLQVGQKKSDRWHEVTGRSTYLATAFVRPAIPPTTFGTDARLWRFTYMAILEEADTPAEWGRAKLRGAS